MAWALIRQVVLWGGGNKSDARGPIGSSHQCALPMGGEIVVGERGHLFPEILSTLVLGEGSQSTPGRQPTSSKSLPVDAP